MARDDQDSRPSVPRHLWIVGVVALLWNAVGAYTYLMTQTRNEAYLSQYTAEQQAFVTGFPVWVDSAWALAVWGAVAGSVLLLLRRRLALPIFAVSLAGMIATTIHNYALNDGVEIMGGVGTAAFSALIFVVAVLLVLYARAMTVRRVLT